MADLSPAKAEKILAICRDPKKPWPLKEIVKLGASEQQAIEILRVTGHSPPEADTLKGAELDAAVAAAGIEGRSSMSADEKRKALKGVG